MKTSLQGTLTAIACGLTVAAAASGSALADDDEGAEYRLLGCIANEDPTLPPFGPTFTVNFSSSENDVGLPCEDVLTQLGGQGFRLIEVSPNFEINGQQLAAQSLLYLERRQDD